MEIYLWQQLCHNRPTRWLSTQYLQSAYDAINSPSVVTQADGLHVPYQCPDRRMNGELSQGDNIQTIVKAAGVTVEPYWPGLFAKLFEKKNIADLITNVGAGESEQSSAATPLVYFLPDNASEGVQHSQ